MSRSKAREHALKVLYAKEINPNTAEISADISDALSEKGKSFSDFLVEQVQLHRDEIDGEIVRFLKKWSLSQLNIVDKNILRIRRIEKLSSMKLLNLRKFMAVKIPIVLSMEF